MSIANTLKFVCLHPLNRGRPVAALVAFLRWQLASRLLPNTEFVFNWINGAKFRVRRGQTGLTGNVYAGLHEFEEMAFLLHYLRPGDLFVDIGANVGSYTILAAAAVRSECIAIEPLPSTFAALVENVRLNHREHTTICVNAALGEHEGAVTFTADADTMNHVALASEASSSRTVTVPLRRLDGIIGDRRPVAMKIDVEGYESPVLAGALATLGGVGPMAIIMELNGSGARYGFDEEALLQKMFDFGFAAYRYEPIRRKLLRISGKNASSGNTIFLRDEAFATQRVTEAAPFSIKGNTV